MTPTCLRNLLYDPFRCFLVGWFLLLLLRKRHCRKQQDSHDCWTCWFLHFSARGILPHQHLADEITHRLPTSLFHFNCRIRSCRNCRSGSCWVMASAFS